MRIGQPVRDGVVDEVLAVVAAQPGPGAEPQVAVLICSDGEDAVVREAVVGGQVHELPAIVAHQGGPLLVEGRELRTRTEPEVSRAVLGQGVDLRVGQLLLTGHGDEAATVVAAQATTGAEPDVAGPVTQDGAHVVAGQPISRGKGDEVDTVVATSAGGGAEPQVAQGVLADGEHLTGGEAIVVGVGDESAAAVANHAALGAEPQVARAILVHGVDPVGAQAVGGPEGLPVSAPPAGWDPPAPRQGRRHVGERRPVGGDSHGQLIPRLGPGHPDAVPPGRQGQREGPRGIRGDADPQPTVVEGANLYRDVAQVSGVVGPAHLPPQRPASGSQQHHVSQPVGVEPSAPGTRPDHSGVGGVRVGVAHRDVQPQTHAGTQPHPISRHPAHIEAELVLMGLARPPDLRHHVGHSSIAVWRAAAAIAHTVDRRRGILHTVIDIDMDAEAVACLPRGQRASDRGMEDRRFVPHLGGHVEGVVAHVVGDAEPATAVVGILRKAPGGRHRDGRPGPVRGPVAQIPVDRDAFDGDGLGHRAVVRRGGYSCQEEKTDSQREHAGVDWQPRVARLTRTRQLVCRTHLSLRHPHPRPHWERLRERGTRAA